MANLLKALKVIGNNFYGLLFGFTLGLYIDVDSGGFCPIEQIIILSIGLFIIALAIQCFFYLILRQSQKAATFTFAVLLWFFAFGAFCELSSQALTGLRLPIPNPNLFLFAYCIIGIIILCICNKVPNTAFMSKSMNTVVLVFFLLILSKEVAHVIPGEQLADKVLKVMRKQNGNIELSAASKPDIYYIILDAATSFDNLRDIYDMHNIDFSDYLKQKGFYVATSSKSNYDRTRFSVPSSLNMNYLNCLTPVLPKDAETDAAFTRLIQKAQVITSLKELGYKIVNVKSGATLTEYDPYADVNIGYSFGNQVYTTVALDMTVLGAIENRTDFIGRYCRAKQSWLFSHAEEVQKIKGPKFVLMHIFLPHQPFLFTADGHPLPLNKQIDGATYLEKYRGQAIYTFKGTEKIIDKLLMLSADKPPIIIVQGDHGPQMFLKGWPYSEAYLKERFGILNAYFLPGTKSTELYRSISPVNSFRVIFNQYFQTHLPLLPDISYYARPEYASCEWTAWHNDQKK